MRTCVPLGSVLALLAGRTKEDAKKKEKSFDPSASRALTANIDQISQNSSIVHARPIRK
jgi:hypothetical protein